MFDIPFTFTYNFLFFLLIRRPCVKTRLCGLFYAQGRGVDPGLCVKSAPEAHLCARAANQIHNHLEVHVQECISVAVFVHVTELQSGTMNKIALPGLFMYMTL